MYVKMAKRMCNETVGRVVPVHTVNAFGRNGCVVPLILNLGSGWW